MKAEIWGDRWLPVKHSPRIVSPWVDMLAESKVSNLIDQDRSCWNREAIEATLLPFEAEIVQKNSPYAILTNPINSHGLSIPMVSEKLSENLEFQLQKCNNETTRK